MKKSVSSPKAPPAIGPYSQAIRFGNLFFLSGQIGIDPKTGALEKGLENQVIRTFKNIKAVLEEEKLDFDDILKTNVYLQNMDDFPKMNEIYKKHFKEPFPSRATVAVSSLPKDALVEIEVLAGLPRSNIESRNGCCGGDCNEC